MRQSMQPELLKRVLIVGTSGSGKSTLARSLGQIREVPILEFDSAFWGPSWTQNSPDFVRAKVASLIRHDSWVLDGNYSTLCEDAWERATAVIWLDYSFPVVFWRACTRTLKRIATQEELYSGNRESIRQAFGYDWIPWWVIRTFSSRRREYQTRLSSKELKSLYVVRLKAPKEADELLKELRAV